MAACRDGDTLVVTKLDRLARSLPDARAIADELTARAGQAEPGGSVYDPTDPVGRLLFNVLAMVAEFEADLITRLRSRRRSRNPYRRPRRRLLPHALVGDGTGQRRLGPDVGVAPPPDLPRHDDLQALFAFDGLIWEGEPLSWAVAPISVRMSSSVITDSQHSGLIWDLSDSVVGLSSTSFGGRSRLLIRCWTVSRLNSRRRR